MSDAAQANMSVADQVRGTRLLRMKDVERRVAVNDSTIYRWIKAGRFPKGIPLGPGSVRWRESDVEAWITARESGHGGK